MREETIYFVMTTRFYDGDTGNDVHCWDDGTAGNGNDDPAWRGDFKGLGEKLDYIKARQGCILTIYRFHSTSLCLQQIQVFSPKNTACR